MNGPTDRGQAQPGVLAPGTTVLQYKIIERIGSGGMAEVYLAEDTRLGRKAALKFLFPQYAADPDIKQRFAREAQAAAALSHPNIVTIYEVAEYQGRPYIAMEYVDGGSLRDVISAKELSTGEFIGLAIQIGEGLSAAHRAGIVHRDIKPQNILISRDGRPKISDFGLARFKGSSRITQDGTTVGTLAYMSPEQAKATDVDQRADIFSLGAVLYEMITRKLPFAGQSEGAIINAILNDVPEPLARYKRDVPEALEKIIEKALLKDREERYQHVDDLVADLRREKRSREFAETSKLYGRVAPARPARPTRRLLKYVLPIAAAATCVVVLLVLEPFRVEMGPKKEAVARENSLAIMYFDNLVDREDAERLGEIVTNLLITSLSESKYVNVVSSQRLYDILKLLGKEGAKAIDRDVATQVAAQAGAKWMLLGSILQVEPQVILTTQLVDVESGQVAASQRIAGETGEKIFPIVDRLAAGLKRDLSLPAEAQQEQEPKVAELTTNSPEAYRYFLEGRDLAMKMYEAEARASYRKAIELDSTFALPYMGLALNWGSRQESGDLIAKALKYSGKATEAERMLIRAVAAYISEDYPKAVELFEKLAAAQPDDKYAFFWLGELHYNELPDPDRGIREMTRAIEIDPLFKPAYNLLAYAYNEIGDLEKSIWAIDKYISIPPEEANQYDSRGDLYAWNGKIDQAVESYRRALEIKPDFYMSLFKLGDMYLYKREYARAESCYKELSSCPDKATRSSGRLRLGILRAYQGKLEEALRIYDDGLAADRMEGAEGTAHASKYGMKASVHLLMRDFDLAAKEARAEVEALKKRESPDLIYGRSFYCYVLARVGRISEAQDVAEAIRRDVVGERGAYMAHYWGSLAGIEMANKNPGAALAYLDKAAAADRNIAAYYSYQSLLAVAYLEAGKLGEAVAVLEKILSRYDEVRLWYAPACVEDHYLLGTAYEKSGWTSKAIEQYREFLEIWKDADPGIPSVEDARGRLAALTAKT